MDALNQIQEMITRNEEQRSQAIELLEGALQLLKGGQASAKTVAIARMPRSERPRYIERAIEVIMANGGRAMGPAAITAVLKKEPQFRNLKRNAIERALFMEGRKDHPRIKRVGEGMYEVVRDKKKSA